MRLHEPVLLAFEPVAVGGEAFQLLGLGSHEPIELVVEHARERILLGVCPFLCVWGFGLVDS
ncbi:hypothetical protein [Microbacterium sp. PAMC22086]|uniref:hypothetical protein n=1 Tax=Microbacterium sp. PAMC22086 TaxID=2861281 RepID=UPI001C633244|nr:hypothetical protein [Microbacterium sp. PAMC22086]QYG13153.1 hypothetical protein KY497_07900 [Microbacterium sp. PAMC22086]